MGRKSGTKKCKPIRERLWYEQGGLCHWCGREMEWTPLGEKQHPSGNQITIDHLDDYPNRDIRVRMRPFRPLKRLVLACASCNHSRGVSGQRFHHLRLSHFLEFDPLVKNPLTAPLD